MIDNLSDLSTAVWLWLTCPGNNPMAQRCSEITAGFVIGRGLAIGFAALVVFVIGMVVFGKKGNGNG